MSANERDRAIIVHIVRYCDEITKTKEYFGESFDMFRGNTIYINAIAMCILQIGELSGYLSDGFKDTYNEVPWRNIKGMRNIMAHKYGEVNASILWETVSADIPTLRDYCQKIVAK